MDTKKQASKLDVKIQSLLELICDLKAMEECVLEMKFDIRKAPLGQCDIVEMYWCKKKKKMSLNTPMVKICPAGKLTSEQIRAGYLALSKIEDCLKSKASHRQLLEACNQFYTRIPHDFG